MAKSWTRNGLANTGTILADVEEPEKPNKLIKPLPHSETTLEKTCPISLLDNKAKEKKLDMIFEKYKAGDAKSERSPHELLTEHINRAKVVKQWYKVRRAHRIKRFRPRQNLMMRSREAR
ncbi:hypothetical protein AAMO2058_000590700 [Amorphochlora amoebiformis]